MRSSVLFDRPCSTCTSPPHSARYGAQAKLPPKSKRPSSQVLKVKKRPRTLRIAGAPQSRGAAPQERDWVLHTVICLQILPPRGADEGHYQNVDERMQVTFQ